MKVQIIEIYFNQKDHNLDYTLILEIDCFLSLHKIQIHSKYFKVIEELV
jgi:hypothetical protein